MKKKLLLPMLLVSLAFGLVGAENRDSRPDTTPEKPAKKTLRAVLELGVNLAGTAAYYWANYKDFLEDWQFTLTWEDQKRKLFTSEGFRLDSNRLVTNTIHSWAGASYYGCARANGLSPITSLLFSTAGSIIWEYVAEWREISSINDHIFTSLGGLTFCEPLHQISSHFRSRPGFANRVACLLVNPLVAANDILDGKKRPARVPTEDWGDFRISLGGKEGPVSPADGSSSHLALDIDLRLVSLPGYGRPGSGSGYCKQPLASDYRVSAGFSGRMYEEINADTRCVMGGWFWKDVRADETGALHGSEFWLGWFTAWDFFQKKAVVAYDGKWLGKAEAWLERERPTRFTDKLSALHLVGPTFNWTAHAGALSARFDLDASFDFSMINSLAFNEYTALHDDWGVKTTLHNWGFYYSLGYSLNSRLDLRLGTWRAEAGLKYQSFYSIQGKDRFQEQVTDDTRLSDFRLKYYGALSTAIPRTPLFLSLRLEGIDRRGSFHEVTAKDHELRLFYRLGVNF
jgi:hypothetical protein